MTKKRKSDSNFLAEVDRTMFATFSSAANSLSQLYSQAQSQQKLAFHAGERHALDKLNQWIRSQQGEGSRVTTANILSYVQDELDSGGEDASMLAASQHTPSNFQVPFSSPSVQISYGSSEVAISTQVLSTANPDSIGNSVFSNALASPLRRSLQTLHMAQEGDYFSNGLQGRSSGYTVHAENQIFHSPRESQSGWDEMNAGNALPQAFGCHDSLMDMNTEGSSHEYYP